MATPKCIPCSRWHPGVQFETQSQWFHSQTPLFPTRSDISRTHIAPVLHPPIKAASRRKCSEQRRTKWQYSFIRRRHSAKCVPRRSDFNVPSTESPNYNGIALQSKIPLSLGYPLVDKLMYGKRFSFSISFPKKEIDKEFALIIPANGEHPLLNRYFTPRWHRYQSSP